MHEADDPEVRHAHVLPDDAYACRLNDLANHELSIPRHKALPSVGA